MKYKNLFALVIFFTLFTQVLAADENWPDKITVCTSYNNLLSNTEQTGLLDRVVAEAFKRIGIEVDFLYSKTNTSMINVNSGLADAEINRIEGMEKLYPNLIMSPEPNMVMRFVAFSKKDFIIDGWESIRDLNIGVVSGWKIYENATEGFPNVTFVPTENELFRMLSRDRIDLALYSKITGYAHLSDEGYGEQIKHIDPPLERKPMYLYLHSSLSGLEQEYAEALRELKEDGTYSSIESELLDR